VLTSCRNGDDSCETGDAFEGCWIYEACQQVSDSSGNPQPIWVRTQYNFTLSGEVLGTTRTHDNANCSGALTNSYLMLGENSATGVTLDHVLLGSATADNGLPAWLADWYWDYSAASDLPAGWPTTVEGNGHVQLSDGRLCLPSWIALGSSGAGVDTGTTQDIEYSYGRCLVRE
jgi:hypothetical protein